MTRSHAKSQGQRSLDSKVKSGNRRTDRQTDRQTEAIALHGVISHADAVTRSVKIVNNMKHKDSVKEG